MSDAKPKPVISPLLNAVIGGVTGAIEISITYPTEYTKTVMQIYKEKQRLGALGVIRETIKNHGFFGMDLNQTVGLYRGYSALLFFSIPKNYVRFGTFHFVKDNVLTTQSKLNTFLCGLSAGAMEALCVVTIQETVKTQLIHDKFMPNPKYKNFFHGIYQIVAHQAGIFGIYKGALQTLLKQSTNQGVRFLVYGETEKFLQNYIPIVFLKNLVAGGFAGFCSVMANNPIDVIKTLRQGKDSHRFNGTMDCVKYIMKESGPLGFYRGVGPRLMRVVADVALTFAIFNGIKDKIKQYIVARRGKTE